MEKKRIFSGIQPSGNLHIGNYLGAIKNWVVMQDDYESIFCVVDMHAITVPQDPEKLRQKTIEIAKIYLAAGIDPQKSIIFIQSHVKAHAELCWILNSVTARMGDLEKMTQFKDKAKLNVKLLEEIQKKLNNANIHTSVSKDIINECTKKIDEQKKIFESREKNDKFFRDAHLELLEIIMNFSNSFNNNQHSLIELYRCVEAFLEDYEKRQNIGVGLFDYPVLMAADILLYDTVTVPVGEDQVQHVELARTLARRFNKRFGETFVVPKYFIKKEGMRIMGLDDPTGKMSKSAESEYNYISLTDDADAVRKKIRKAVTDSGEEIVYRDDKPALKNLINIYASFSGLTTQQIEEEFAGKRYGEFKDALADVIIAFLKPFQEKMQQIGDEEVLRVLRDGAQRAEEIAEAKIRTVKEKIGFIV